MLRFHEKTRQVHKGKEPQNCHFKNVTERGSPMEERNVGSHVNGISRKAKVGNQLAVRRLLMIQFDK